MRSFVNITLQPAMYHGHNKRAPFFEGWYYKLVSADETQRYAVIPGVILGEDQHAFIQLLDGTTGQSSYHTYPISAFWASDETFEIRIGKSRFTNDSVQLDVDSMEGSLKGELKFVDPKPWPVDWKSPGIMGWYAWVPFMETYHGVLSFDHLIEGSVNIDGKNIDFSSGRGYIEKDWGQSFPSAWVWFQSNHFETPGICITASVAIIPWLWSSFRGFIIGFWWNGSLYRFATYTGGEIESLDIFDDRVEWVVRDKNYRLSMTASRPEAGLIRGPTKIDMGKRVNETLQAEIEVRLSDLDGRVIYEGNGRNGGLEVEGDLTRLLVM